MKASIIYSIKVWLTTSIVAPFLSFFIDNIFHFELVANYSAVGTRGFIFFAIIFGLIFSIPALVLFFAIVYFLQRTNLTSTKIKYSLGFASIILAILTLVFCYTKYVDIELVPLFIAYPITTTMFTLSYSLPTSHRQIS